jgi:endonuclease G
VHPLLKASLTPVVHFLGTRKLPPSLPANEIWPSTSVIQTDGLRVLCNSFYLVVFDEKNKRCLLSADVTQQHPTHLARENCFAKDPRVIGSPTPEDYHEASWDRGHMTPSGDAGTQEQEDNTFLMTNMTPQHPDLNRKDWRMLEEHIRTLDTNFVITGACYNTNQMMGNTGIPIPSSYWKVVYLKNGEKIGYAANNKPGKTYTIPVADLERLTGYKF